MPRMELTLEKQTHPLYPFFKRLFDLLFSLSFILIFFPVYLIIALLIKLDSKGPIFYVGKRLGKEKKHISIFKFRTMYLDAEERLDEMLKKDPKMEKEWKIYQKLQNDHLKNSHSFYHYLNYQKLNYY